MFITDPKLPITERIELLNIREGKLLEEIQTLDINLKSTEGKIQDIILDWALIIEEQQILGAYARPINTICSRIIGLLKENGLDELTKFAYTLPDKFKQVKFSNAGLFGAAHRTTPFNAVNDTVESEFNSYRAIEKEEYVKNMLSEARKIPVYLPSNVPLEELDNDEIRKRYDLIKDIKSRLRLQQSELEEFINSKKIALINENVVNHISTEKPEPKETKFYYTIENAITEFQSLINTLEQFKEKVRQFPPDEEDSETLSDYFGTFIHELIGGLNEFFRPFKDEKWTQTYVEWFETALKEIDHGKHAAGKMSAGLSYKGEIRALTREQVGDKKEILFEVCLLLCKMFQWVDALTEYHKKYPKPRILDRKIRLSGVLSEKA